MERRLFLKFTTGAARLPASGLGAWAALSPPFTVVRAVPPAGVPADLLLPTCSTCQVRMTRSSRAVAADGTHQCLATLERGGRGGH